MPKKVIVDFYRQNNPLDKQFIRFNQAISVGLVDLKTYGIMRIANPVLQMFAWMTLFEASRTMFDDEQ